MVPSELKVVPGIYRANKTAVPATKFQHDAVPLRWPTNVSDGCEPVLVSSLAFDAPEGLDATDPKSPWRQPMATSWSVELAKKILHREGLYAQGHLASIVDASGQICPLPSQFTYNELYDGLQQVQTAKKDFPLLVVVDKRPANPTCLCQSK